MIKTKLAQQLHYEIDEAELKDVVYKIVLPYILGDASSDWFFFLVSSAIDDYGTIGSREE